MLLLRVEAAGSSQSGHYHLQCDSFDYLAMRNKGEVDLFIQDWYYLARETPKMFSRE